MTPQPTDTAASCSWHCTLARAHRLAQPGSPARGVAHRAALGGSAAAIVLGPCTALGAMALCICLAFVRCKPAKPSAADPIDWHKSEPPA